MTIIARNTHVAKSPQYPAGVDFAVIGRICVYEHEKDVIRIDNSFHHGSLGTHIHFLDKQGEPVEFTDEIKNLTQALTHVEEYLRKRYAWLIEGENNAN